MTLTVEPNTHPEFTSHRFTICADRVPIGYANSRLKAHLAAIEIKKSLKRLDARLRRYEADEPMTPLRKVYWNASRQAF